MPKSKHPSKDFQWSIQRFPYDLKPTGISYSSPPNLDESDPNAGHDWAEGFSFLIGRVVNRDIVAKGFIGQWHVNDEIHITGLFRLYWISRLEGETVMNNDVEIEADYYPDQHIWHLSTPVFNPWEWPDVFWRNDPDFEVPRLG